MLYAVKIVTSYDVQFGAIKKIIIQQHECYNENTQGKSLKQELYIQKPDYRYRHNFQSDDNSINLPQCIP